MFHATLRLLALFAANVSLAAAPAAPASAPAAAQRMDRMWGEATAKAATASADRAALFRDGNYGMFMHFGLYSHLGGQWRGQTFYGIGEWITRQMKIPVADYMALAQEFNPSEFDARAIAQLARAAGMKWIIVGAKHHEGFAMFKSAHPFNIVDATPFKRDPMKELAAACREAGLGFGFYYSHNQDWTAPGGTNGPTKNPDGTPATFARYFREKCFPQVKEICTGYGPLNFIWFDTPGNMPKELVIELEQLVRQTQPGALLCSRIGHGLGDYVSKGDMEVPPRNLDGLWETSDTTNDSWSFAWYDENWKDSREIVRRLVNTVGRGGTYLLNIGPDGKGRVPPQAARFLRHAGEWIQRYPQVVYSAGPSPWGYALPWGDATTQGKTLHLAVFDWPQDGRLWLPGLQTRIESAHLLAGGKRTPVRWSARGTWTGLQLPAAPPDRPAGVIALEFAGPPRAEPVLGVHPNCPVTLLMEFAEVTGATKKEIRWMEKFGEWKHVN
jgi:alpha-L-fucosidase